jgi:hypothetical protein
MYDAALHSNIVALIDSALQRHGSDANRALLVSRISKMAYDGDNTKKTFRRIRTVIALLVSEELAEDIYKELLKLQKEEDADNPLPMA